MKLHPNAPMRIIVLLAASVFISAAHAQPPLPKLTPRSSLMGIWEGDLHIRGGAIRIDFTIGLSDDREIKATLDVPSQNAKGIPCDSIAFKGSAVHIEMSRLHASYDGIPNEAGTAISGTFNQNGAAVPLYLNRVEKPTEFKRPQMPLKPFPYREEFVSYPNKSAGNVLAGTLTLPAGDGPFPVTLLITGSGPQDRDESMMGHKPFLVIADYLTRRGIAVLRVDDRGIGQSTGNFATATTADFATDVEAGVAYLETRKEIDPRKIGLIGHSEGAIIAPMLAGRNKNIAFIVMLAGSTLRGDELIARQAALVAKASGASAESIKQVEERQREILKVVVENKDNAVARKKLGEMIGPANPAIGSLLSPWYRYFLEYDPAPSLEKVTCPVLALNGELDTQVPPKEDLAIIRARLAKTENKDVTVLELPRLNHLFQTGTTGSPNEYSLIEETIAPSVLELIGNWVTERMLKPEVAKP
jgi:pimeloyl-ACP methyl ester carboxylesterase